MPLLLLVFFWTRLCNTEMVTITFRYSLQYIRVTALSTSGVSNLFIKIIL